MPHDARETTATLFCRGVGATSELVFIAGKARPERQGRLVLQCAGQEQTSDIVVSVELSKVQFPGSGGITMSAGVPDGARLTLHSPD